MGSTVIRFAGLACMFLVSETPTRSTDDGNTAETLAVRARQLQALWVDGTPRLRLRAELDFLAANGTAAHGQYLVDWISPTRWREEIRSGGYSRVRVHDARGYWQKSELGFQPEVTRRQFAQKLQLLWTSGSSINQARGDLVEPCGQIALTPPAR